MKKPPLIQMSDVLAGANALHLAVLVDIDEMEAERRPHGEEAGDLAALL